MIQLDQIKNKGLRKSDIEEQARRDAFELVEAAMISPVERLVLAKQLEAYIQTYVKGIMGAAIEEREKNKEKDYKVGSATTSMAETGVKYTYNHDPEWCEYKAKEDEWKAKRTAREAFLKAMKEPITTLNEETGEVTKLHPPVRTSTTVVKVTL